MEVELITIGDEILIGQTVDTNSAWMAKQFNALGINVSKINSIKDEREAILEELAAAFQRSQLIITTGGLGPTKDDITKQVLCDFFDTALVRNQAVLDRIEAYFQSRGREILETNRQQADLPESAEVLDNLMGTASGMWFEKKGKVVVSLPGVPYEMKHLMQEQVLPKVKAKYKLPKIHHHTVMTEGVGESFLAEMVKDWENSLPNEGIKIAYLPSPGIVKVRLTAEGKDLDDLKEKVSRKAKELNALVPQYIFGENDIRPEEAIAQMLKEQQKTVATAESCTGGYLAHLFTSIPGSSDYFQGSVISYSNQLKMNLLEVSSESLDKYGAVSQAVVEQMARHARQKMNTDYALATSGVAGPDGGSDEKPVGTVWIALASAEGVFAKRFQFEQNRERNIQRSALAAIGMLRRALAGELEIGA
ncbi:MAG: competence/damage-inducible protein A [Vicingaceae bacterium]